MEFKINHVPFKMNEITAKLFNDKFLSDIVFIVDEKPIYAHSLELMKRSVVFQSQLESGLTDKKTIPITSYSYESFYQLIRFIYTDEYAISEENYFELLKLAKVYNVLRLVDVLLNFSDNNIAKLNFSIVENHKIAVNVTKIELAAELNWILESEDFLKIHPDTVEEILKLERVTEDVKEHDIFDALLRWMNHHCIVNHIQLSECRQRFDKLFRLIRFPTLSGKELRDIKSKYPDLLSQEDFMNIAGKKIYGTDRVDEIKYCTPRMEFIWPFEYKQFLCDNHFETKFSVFCDIILGGFVFGASSTGHEQVDITISCQTYKLNKVTELNINEVDVRPGSVIISLGTSVRIHPNFIYTIHYKTIHETGVKRSFWSRKKETKVIINGPRNFIKIIEAHETMHEIYFMAFNDNKTNILKC